MYIYGLHARWLIICDLCLCVGFIVVFFLACWVWSVAGGPRRDRVSLIMSVFLYSLFLLVSCSFSISIQARWWWDLLLVSHKKYSLRN